jgi:hypothetical protein
LSDYILALRGLLDAMDEAGQPTLARRLAALCAEEDVRPLLQARVEAALSLELALVAGVPIDTWSAPPGVSSPRDIVIEIEEHLRALLRDVACGYLKPTLASTADEILLRTAAIDVNVRDLRGDVEIDHPDAEAPLHPPTHGADAEPVAGESEDREAEDEWSTPDPRLAPVAERPSLVQPGAMRVSLSTREAEPMSPPEPEPMSPPEAEPRVTRVEPTVATVDEYGQTALVVDDFAWDIDDPDDYAAGV